MIPTYPAVWLLLFMVQAYLSRKSNIYLQRTCCRLPLGIIRESVTSNNLGAGHSCWGILNAPATGQAMAELIVDGKEQKRDSLISEK